MLSILTLGLRVWTMTKTLITVIFTFVQGFDHDGFGNNRPGDSKDFVKQNIKMSKAYPRLMVVVYLLKGGTEARSRSK